MAKQAPKRSTSTKPKETASAETPATSSTKPTQAYDPSTLFWGGLFIVVGTLLLLHNLDIITVRLENLWLLWPLAIVGAGVSFFSVQSRLAKLIVSLLILASLALAAYVAIEHTAATDDTKKHTATTQLERSAQRLDVTINTGGASMTLGTHNDNQALRTSLESNFNALKQTSSLDGDTQNIALTTEGLRRFAIGPTLNTLDSSFTTQLPLTLTIDSGATKIRGDLRHAQLNKLTLDSGASTIDLTLGARRPLTEVTIDAGASTITLRLPKAAGVRVETDNGLTSATLDDLSKVDEDTFESTNYSDADRKILIKTDLGAAKFTVLRY